MRGCDPLVDGGTQTESEGPEGERLERWAAVGIAGRETSNTEGGLPPDPAGPRGGHVPDVHSPFGVKMN